MIKLSNLLTWTNQNGDSSTHNSCKMHPRAHISLANENWLLSNVSGAMYNGVPPNSRFHVINRFLKSQFSLKKKKNEQKKNYRTHKIWRSHSLTHSSLSTHRNRPIWGDRCPQSKCYPVLCLCAPHFSCANIQCPAADHWNGSAPPV